MDIETLNTFITLAKTKSFSSTANQLFIAQSTVTNRIQNLEKEVNKQLFIRNNKTVELTAQGRAYLPYAQRISELSENAIQAINKPEKYTASLHIGTVNSIYEGYLNDIILRYVSKHPHISLKIVIGQSSHLLEQLQDKIIDFAILYLPFNKSGYDCKLYNSERLCLVTPYKNKEFAKGIHMDELISINYLMCNFGLQNIGEFIHGLFPKHYQFGFEIDDCEKVIPFLFETSGYSFLPEHMVKEYIQNKTLREVPLIDFDAPTINIYAVGSQKQKELWEDICGHI